MYEYVNYYNVAPHSDELYHYGVKGMKWGVRRATKQLSKATTNEQRQAAIKKLQKHRAKATAEIAKLEKKRPKLEETVDKKIVKNEAKAAKLMDKAASKRNRAYGVFTSQSKAESLLYDAGKLEAQAKSLTAKSKKAKAMLAKNETMTKMFKQGVKDIDDTLVKKGRKYING